MAVSRRASRASRASRRGGGAESVSGDWMYEDALLHKLGAGPSVSPPRTPASARSAGGTSSAGLMMAPYSFDGATRKLPKPGRSRGAELLDLNSLRRMIPTRNRTALLSTAHRRKRAAMHPETDEATPGSRLSKSASLPPSWLEHLPISKDVKHKTMRARWKAMEEERNKPKDEGTLDAETRKEMAEEKQELAKTMGLTMAELEEMDAAANEEDEEEEYKKAFEQFDQDGSGDISPDEVRLVIQNLGIELGEDEIDQMILDADEDGDGTINYVEFVHMMKAKKTLLTMAKVLSRSKARSRSNSVLSSTYLTNDESMNLGQPSSASGLPPLKLDGRSGGRRHQKQHQRYFSRPTPAVLVPGARIKVTPQRLRKELATSKRIIKHLNDKVKDDVAWVQANCPVTNIRAQMFCQKWGLEKMQNVMQRIHHSFLIAAMRKWLEYTEYKANRERAEAYLKYKGSRTLVNMFVNWKKKKQQTAWNSWMDMVYLQREMEEDAATLKIQRVARGFMARKFVKRIRSVRATIAIQRIVRGKLARLRVERIKYFNARTEAARYIQRRWRGFAGRQLLKVMFQARKEYNAATTIQRIGRGYLGRKRFAVIEAQHYRRVGATEFQRVWRGFLDRRLAAAKRHTRARHRGATAVEKVFRGFVGRNRARVVRRRFYGAVKIQAWVRGVWGRRKALMRKKQLRVVIIQCAWRCHLARAELRRRVEYKAARRIQLCWRGRIARRTYYAMLKAKKEHDLRCWAGAINIQRIARGYMTRRWMANRKQRELEDDAAVQIQRVVRGFMGRRKFAAVRDAKERFEEETEAATAIQAVYRGYCGRKIYNIKRKSKNESEAAARALEEKLRSEEAAKIARMDAEAAEEASRVAAERAAAATQIQRIARGKLARNRVECIRRANAAKEIQRLARGKLARQRVHRMKDANAAAAHAAMMKKIADEQAAAATRIQCMFRARQARRKVQGVREAHAAEQARAEAAAKEAAYLAEEAAKLRAKLIAEAEASGGDTSATEGLTDEELVAMVRTRDIIAKENAAAEVLQAAALGWKARKDVASIKHEIRHVRGGRLEELRLQAVKRHEANVRKKTRARELHQQRLAKQNELFVATMNNAHALDRAEEVAAAAKKNEELFERLEQEEAAARIVAAARVRVAKFAVEKQKLKLAAELKAAEEAQMEEEKLAILRAKQERELAATKIQSLLRGRKARIQARIRREELEAQRKAAEEARIALERDLAASKIQALYRGRKDRARVRVLREEVEAQRAAEYAAWEEAEAARLEEERLAAEAEAAKLPEGWEEYWDDNMQAAYYFNVHTQEARWVRPTNDAAEGYGTTGEVADYETDNPNSNTPICVDCEYEHATRVCDQCEDNFCDACYDAAHAQGRKQRHTWQPVAQFQGGVEIPFCIECEELYATKRCDQCGDPYCDDCYSSTHARGNKRNHTFSSVVQMCVECEEKAATRACAQCMDPYCDECYNWCHRKGKKQQHTWTHVVATKEEAQEWLEYYDETYGRPYYYNPYTQETVWNDPRKATA